MYVKLKFLFLKTEEKLLTVIGWDVKVFHFVHSAKKKRAMSALTKKTLFLPYYFFSFVQIFFKFFNHLLIFSLKILNFKEIC